MAENKPQSEMIIRGSCTDFVCKCCRTKFGWAHQVWCDYGKLTEPGCADCVYYNLKRERCSHPAKKWKWRDAG